MKCNKEMGNDVCIKCQYFSSPHLWGAKRIKSPNFNIYHPFGYLLLHICYLALLQFLYLFVYVQLLLLEDFSQSTNLKNVEY